MITLTPWTVDHQAPLFSLGFFQQEYWSGYHFLFQGIFPTQRWNLSLLCLLHLQADSLSLSHLGNPELPYDPAIIFLGLYPKK